MVDRGVDQPLALGFLGDVAGMRRRHAALGLDHLDRALCELQVEVGHQHLDAGACQQDRRRPAVADAVAYGAAAGNDRDLAGQAGVVLGTFHLILLKANQRPARRPASSRCGLRASRPWSARFSNW